MTIKFLQVSFDKLEENIRAKVVMLRGMELKQEKEASPKKERSDSDCKFFISPLAK